MTIFERLLSLESFSIIPSKFETLSLEQKLSLLKEQFTADKGLFLEKYGRYLLEEELLLFVPFASDYTVNFYLEKYQIKSVSKKKIQNRRLNRMKELEKNGYFSEEAIQMRDYYLYERYLGKYARPYVV